MRSGFPIWALNDARISAAATYRCPCAQAYADRAAVIASAGSAAHVAGTNTTA